MTYNVSMGTLNPTIPYHTIPNIPHSLGLFSVFARHINELGLLRQATDNGGSSEGDEGIAPIALLAAKELFVKDKTT